MNIALYSSSQLVLDVESSCYYTKSYIHLQFPELAHNFDNMDVVAFVRKINRDEDTAEYMKFDSHSVNVVPVISIRGHWVKRLFQLPVVFLDTLRQFIQNRQKWDVVLLWDLYYTNFFVFWLCRLLGKPVVLFLGGDHAVTVLHGIENNIMDHYVAQMKSLWYRIAIPIVASRSQTYITSEEYAKKLNMDLKNSISTVESITTTTASEKDIDHEVIGRRKMVAGELTLLNVCRVLPVKKIETVIRSMSLLSGKGLNLKFLIVGPIQSPAYYDVLKNEIKTMGLSDSVEFMGPITDRKALLELYSKSDVFVLTSKSEGYPKVIPEAMAKGLPIIATSVGGLPSLITDGENGFLISVDNEKALADRIERLACDLPARLYMSEKSLALAKNYTLEHQMGVFAKKIKNSVLKYSTN